MPEAQILRKIGLFSGLNSDQLEYLASRMTSRTVSALQPVFWVGDPGHELFVIESGRIEICIPDTEGKEIRLAILGPGDFLGEISLLDGGPRTATARALESAHLLSIGREDFQRCILDFPPVALSIINVLSLRQRNTVEKLRGIRNLNEVLEQAMTPWQKASVAVAKHASSPTFLIVHVVAVSVWLLVNSILQNRGIDPFPFPFLCFWASLESIFLSLFILISQSMQSQKDRIRGEIEYQVALKLQLEMMQLHLKLDEQATILKQLAGQTVEAS